MTFRSSFILAVVCLTLASGLRKAGAAVADTLVTDNPLRAAGQSSSRTPLARSLAPAGDPIRAAQVMAAAEKTFPNLTAELENADLLGKAAVDPRMRGNLRGRLAEQEFLQRHGKQGWQEVAKRNAPQNDVFRWKNGRLEGAQIKVHEDWTKYIRSMRDDNKAERFVIPDDHYDLVHKDLETRRLGALRAGDAVKAAEYSKMQQRLTKLGRTFSELDGAIETAAKHYTRIAAALRTAGRAASFIGIAVGVLDTGISVYEVATGKAEIEQVIEKATRAGIAGAASWGASTAVLAALGPGMVPVLVTVVVAGGTYLVVDWAVGKTIESFRATPLTHDDLNKVWKLAAASAPIPAVSIRP